MWVLTPVFYVGSCYSRYSEQYRMAMSLEGCIFDTCALATAHIGNHDEILRLWRYLNLIHVLA